MAKECINCGRKVGIISGEHFGGLLCDNCYNSFGGMSLISLEMENDIEKYLECYQKIEEDVDKNVKLTKKENKCLKKAKADIGNNETIKQLTINDVLDEIACGNVKLEDVRINKIDFKNKGNYLGNNKKRCGYG